MVETILLVDDEVPIRRLIQRMLDDQGYHVLEASDGDEALRVAADYRGSINLLVTDVVMPALDGFTLVPPCLSAATACQRRSGPIPLRCGRTRLSHRRSSCGWSGGSRRRVRTPS